MKKHAVVLKDIASALGVSEATVSLALNNRPNVAEGTRQRVLEYAASVGYTPNPLARGLATQRTMTIGLVCPDTENPYYGSFVKHISDRCESYGYSLVLALSRDSAAREAEVLDSFVDKKFDGVILMPLNLPENPLADFQRLNAHGVPLVFCTSYYSNVDADCVRGDYFGGSYQLTRYLLESGHRELWYLVTRDQGLPVAAERLHGFRKAFEDLHLPLDESWIVGCDEVNSASGYEVTRELLRVRSAPDGILTLNDYMAFGVMRSLQELGFAVPDDISVAGYDDVFYAAIATPPLTTVRQDLDEISRTCVELLMSKVGGGARAIPRPGLIESKLIVRETTRLR